MFKEEIISPHIIRIRNPINDGAYVVKGSKYTVLIDTFVGTEGLRTYLEKELNICIDYVLLTHGHVDHVGGMGEFEELPAYLNFADLDMAREQAGIRERMAYLSYAAAYTGQNVTEFTLAKPYQFTDIRDLEDKRIFDLGDVHIKTFHISGHTKGLCMFLITEDRAMIFGDGCGNCVLLLNDGSSTVEAYRDGLVKLKEYEKEYDTVLRFHGSCESDKALLDSVICCCDDILAGKDDHQHEEHPIFPCGDAYYAKALAEDGRSRKDGGYGNICYRMSKIYEKH